MASWQSFLFYRSLKLYRRLRPLEGLAVKTQRRRFDRGMRLLGSSKAGVHRDFPGVSFSSVSINSIPSLLADPGSTHSAPIILFLHGGGHVIGSRVSYRRLVANLATKTKTKVLLPEYRLAPEHPYPAALEDTVAAYTWLLGHGYDPNKIIIAGDSAGGNLTLATLLKIRDSGLPLPNAAVTICPVTDFVGTGPSLFENAGKDLLLTLPLVMKWSKQYLGDADLRDPYASPLYADLSGLPPLLISGE